MLDTNLVIAIVAFSVVAAGVGMGVEMILNKMGFASAYRQSIVYALVSIISLLVATQFLPKQFKTLQSI